MDRRRLGLGGEGRARGDLHVYTRLAKQSSPTHLLALEPEQLTMLITTQMIELL